MVEYTLWDQCCQCSMFKFAWTKLSPPTEWSFSATANPKEQFYYLQCCAFAYLRAWAEIVWEFSSVQLLLELWWRIVWGGNIKNSVDLHILTIGKSFWWIYSQNCKRFLSQENLEKLTKCVGDQNWGLGLSWVLVRSRPERS